MAGSSKFVAVNFVSEEGSLRAPSHTQILGFTSCHSVLTWVAGVAIPWFWRVLYRGDAPKVNVFWLPSCCSNIVLPPCFLLIQSKSLLALKCSFFTLSTQQALFLQRDMTTNESNLMDLYNLIIRFLIHQSYVDLTNRFLHFFGATPFGKAAAVETFLLTTTKINWQRSAMCRFST